MSLLTNWGYTLTEVDYLPDLMTAEEYATMTGRNDDASRVTEEIAAACAAIRNYVGWHLGPSEECKMSATFMDRRVTRVGCDVLIQLPARYVTDIGSVKINGTERENYILDPSGLLRVIEVGYEERYAPVVVEYTAGLPDAFLIPIKELVAHRVTHAMAVPPGITSEAAGGVSVTYNANWINNSRATALAGDNKELLVPYKVMGVF